MIRTSVFNSVAFLLLALLLCDFSSAQDELKVGDKVVVKFGPDEFEGTVTSTKGFGGFIEVEYEDPDFNETITSRFPRNFIELVESAEVPSSTDESAYRLWTDSTGKHKIKAELVSNSNGRVELKKEDGRVVTLALKKLSTADRQYLEELDMQKASENDPDNPFAGGVDASSKKANRSGSGLGAAEVSPEFGTNIVDLYVNGWSYKPDKGESNNKLKNIGFRIRSSDNSFHNRPSQLMISLNKKAAATLVGNPFNKDNSTAVIFDLENGRAIKTVRLPIVNSNIVAVSNDGKRIATAADITGMARNNSGMEIWNLEGKEPKLETSWSTASLMDRSGFAPKTGAFVGNGRLLTAGNNVILWDIESASDLYTVDGIDPGSFAFSANNRQFAFQRGDSVYIADTLKGTCLGVLETTDSGKSKIAFSQSGQFLAIARLVSREVHVWDLTTQEIVREFTIAEGVTRSLAWAGDEYILIGGRDLVDVTLRVPVWQYIHRGGINNSFASTNDGRFWFVQQAGLKGVRIPERNLAKRLSQIDPDSLLVLKPGSEVELVVKLPFSKSENEEIRENLLAQLEANGVSVQGGAQLKLVASFEKLKRESMEVSDFHDPLALRGTEKLSFAPTKVYVKLMRGNEELWSRSSTSRPGSFIHLENGETAQQAANRLCEVSPTFFDNMKIPKKISKLPGGKPLGQTQLIR